ncbi:cyclase family protein [Shewanella sp. NIFS-20-20]|uniref:cyclase family protein n=1 Tax=Shewanella sp. NIFS-20-20 TaxID=2853806 RepID=UPI001C439017|nr:cyclase family protein [Shewanella sp. NIFS-20-20]
MVEPDHPAYQWAKRQSDAVNAFGHIGTHIDCYESVPAEDEYLVDVVIIDCRQQPVSMADLHGVALTGKALILYSGNLEQHGYATPSYGAQDTAISSAVLTEILQQAPAFIVIDSYGIGTHGEQHISFDKRCESAGCFVIENVNLTHADIRAIKSLKIVIDTTDTATGKRCQLTALGKAVSEFA